MSSAVLMYFIKHLQAQRMTNQDDLPPVYNYASEVVVTLDKHVIPVSIAVLELEGDTLEVSVRNPNVLQTKSVGPSSLFC